MGMDPGFSWAHVERLSLGVVELEQVDESDMALSSFFCSLMLIRAALERVIRVPGLGAEEERYVRLVLFTSIVLLGGDLYRKRSRMQCCQ